jgi:hypothetical protein
MNSELVLFVSGAVLLVPLIYASSAIPDACAAIRTTNYDSGDCTGDKFDKKGKTCCWYEKSYPGQFGRGDKYCQTCKTTDNGKSETCTSPEKQTIKLPSGSQLLQDLPELKSTDNKTISSNNETDIKSRSDAPTFER